MARWLESSACIDPPLPIFASACCLSADCSHELLAPKGGGSELRGAAAKRKHRRRLPVHRGASHAVPHTPRAFRVKPCGAGCARVWPRRVGPRDARWRARLPLRRCASASHLGAADRTQECASAGGSASAASACVCRGARAQARGRLGAGVHARACGAKCVPAYPGCTQHSSRSCKATPRGDAAGPLQHLHRGVVLLFHLLELAESRKFPRLEDVLLRHELCGMAWRCSPVNAADASCGDRQRRRATSPHL